MNLKALFHIYFHKSFSYSLPSAGKLLKWDCECIKCGASFQVCRPNTPQWVSPIKRDKSKPKTWAWEAVTPQFILEWWGFPLPYPRRMRPAWKMAPNGDFYMPLFLGLWVKIPEPKNGPMMKPKRYDGNTQQENP